MVRVANLIIELPSINGYFKNPIHDGIFEVGWELKNFNSLEKAQ
jgi:hypothetical protein